MPEKAPKYLDVGSRRDAEPTPATTPEALVAATPDTGPTSVASSEAPVPTITADTAPPSPDGLPTPDTEPATSTETFTTDVEILGKHYPIRQMIREAGNQRMRAVESVSASWKNILDTPGKMRLGLVRSLAEGRLNRKKAKFEAVSHLSDRNWLKRRRKNKMLKAQKKFDTANEKYQGRKDRMTARRENVGKNVEQRRANYRKELRARRETALGRRALRHELRAQDAGRFEARAILKDIPKEHLERVGKLAATAYASERKAAQADKQKKATISHETRTLEAISDNRRRMGEAANEAKKADGIVEKLKTETIPKAKEHLESLQAQLDDYEDDDPARTSLQIQIQETEDRIAIYEQREVPYWSQVALSNRQRVLTLDENHSTLTANLTQNTTAKKAAVTNATAARATADTHKAELLKAAAEATDSAPESNN